MHKKLGFVGLGLMGFPMAERLLNAGSSLAIFNRTPDRATPLLSKGATWCATPAAVGAESDVVLSMVSTSVVLENVSLGHDGILSGLAEDSIHVDFSTVSPATTERVRIEYSSKRRHFVHCPVLGSVPHARDGKLLLFAGGEPEVVKQIAPLLAHLGDKIWTFDRPEVASHTKLLCNSFIAGMVTTLSQALVYSKKAGVDQHTLLDILSHSALNAPMYQTKGKSMIEGNFSPRFFLEHMLKDIRLILESAERMHVTMPGIVAAEEIYKEAGERGFGKEDYSAVIKVLAR